MGGGRGWGGGGGGGGECIRNKEQEDLSPDYNSYSRPWET